MPKKIIEKDADILKIIDNYKTFLSKRHKNISTTNAYVNWMYEVQKWLIDNKLCNKSYSIWKDKEIIDEVNKKLNNEFYGIWTELNKNNHGWYSAPWNCWVEYNSKIEKLEDFKIEKTNDVITKKASEEKHQNNLTIIPFSINKFSKDINRSNLRFSEILVKRFFSSLCTKPFVILTGLSGSGKTKLAQIFVKWICKEKDQYCIVPVGADWTNREPLLGYPNALEPGKYVMPDNEVLKLIIKAAKEENQNKPYFLILDEMNLSHVERYFADFLSAMESGEDIPLHAELDNWEDDVPPKIKLHPNLFIIGTVNIDETTYMFSPKVLDRANVIEFRVTEEEMVQFLNNIQMLDLENIRGIGAGMAESFVQLAKNRELKPVETKELNTSLTEFFKELKKTGAEFGYRSASEIHRFAAVVNHLDPERCMTDIIDWAIMQKLLPKVHGSKRKLDSVLKTIGNLCLQDGQKLEDFITQRAEINFSDTAKIKYPVSFEKIIRMYNNLLANGFTSYAEA